MTDIATFAGGCFWCTEAVFDALRGVEAVESGYIGGHVAAPTYAAVCGGTRVMPRRCGSRSIRRR